MNNSYNIIFAADDKYLKYTAVTITSIVKHTKLDKTLKDYSSINKEIHGENYICEMEEDYKEKYIFHILTDGIVADTEKKLNILSEELNSIFPIEIKVHTISNKDFIDFPPLRNSYLAYYRLKMLDIFSIIPNKALYLDGDIAINCDIREIFALDLNNNVLAACEDFKLKREFPSYKKVDMYVHDSHYFNSGVMLINVKAWKDENIEEKAMTFLNKYMVRNHDQDALNVAVDKFLILPSNWNGLYLPYDIYSEEKNNHLDDEQYFELIKNIQESKIFHYASRKKPWLSSGVKITEGNINCFQIPFYKYWWYLAKQTPGFKDDLIAITQTETYKKNVDKEEKILKLYNSDSFTSKIYIFIQQIKYKLNPYRVKIEAPFKKIRNKLRKTLQNKTQRT